jgi:isoleucyl-tRNA synthetase
MDTYSADALRLLLLSSPLLSGDDFALIDKDVADVARKLAMIWNMFDFFTLYADVDEWEWNGKLDDPLPSLNNPLDIWIVSRLHQLNAEVETHMDKYDLPNALKPILPFIDDASNWYVRRSRRRFWKSGDDSDKQQAYRTLHFVLVRLSMIMAPLTPFLAEELYQKLTGGESVHLLDWPTAGHADELALEKMAYIREVINQGLSQRATAGIKVRQPLSDLYVKGAPTFFESIENDYLEIIKEELNVKNIFANTHNVPQEITLDMTITPELKREGMVREVIRNIQNARKQAGLDVDDHIVLGLSTTDSELRQAIDEHADSIKNEVLARSVEYDQSYVHELACAVGDAPLTISLQKKA